MSERMVLIVGPIPKPIGGVAVFTYRLVWSLKQIISEVIDLYPNLEKMSIPEGVTHSRLGKDNPISLIVYLRKKIESSNAKVVHFNFSHAHALLLLFFLKKGKKKWCLTLHSGNIFNSWIARTRFARWLLSIALKRVNSVFVLSTKQKEDYRSMLDRQSGLVYVRSYVKPVINERLKKTLEEKALSTSQKIKILISGSHLPEYNMDWLMDYADENRDINLEFKICLYHYGDMAAENKLRERAKSDFRVAIHKDLSTDDFNNLLASCNIYVRPVINDSFGIVVADAINFGLVVLASDCCERYSGAKIFKNGNKTELFQSLDELVNNRQILKIIDRKINNGPDDVQGYLNEYLKLSEKI